MSASAKLVLVRAPATRIPDKLDGCAMLTREIQVEVHARRLEVHHSHRRELHKTTSKQHPQFRRSCWLACVRDVNPLPSAAIVRVALAVVARRRAVVVDDEAAANGSRAAAELVHLMLLLLLWLQRRAAADGRGVLARYRNRPRGRREWRRHGRLLPDVVVVDLLLCYVVFMVEANGRRMSMNGWQWQWCLVCAKNVFDELLLWGKLTDVVQV